MDVLQYFCPSRKLIEEVCMFIDDNIHSIALMLLGYT